jgi:Flp pilus assembly protein TadD
VNTQQLLNLAITHHQSGRLAEAEEIYRRVLEVRPNYADALHLLGLVVHHRGEHKKAIQLIRRAIEQSPREGRFYGNLGNVLAADGRLDEAAAAYRTFLGMCPSEPRGHYNLGNVFRQMGMTDDAIASFRRAIQYKPDYGEAHGNLGDSLNKKGKIDEAIAAYATAVRIMPDDPAAHVNYALALLLKGDFEKGLPEKEWRKRLPSFLSQRQFPQPQWDGGDLGGKRIVVQCEQGLGDSIHFARYCAMVAERGGKVRLFCDLRLHRLFRNLKGVESLVWESDSASDCELQCQLMSLPLIFKTDLSSIPAAIPYLMPERELVENWKLKISAGGEGLRVGLTWAGNPEHLDDRSRSIKPVEFAPLANVPGIVFHSLQKGSTQPVDPAFRWVDSTAELQDFADTAAMIANLDLVISVDTSVAHLAGAMGKPVWLLIPFTPDWRWLLNRDDTPWYPTMRLFRQTRPGDWAGVVQRVCQALRDRVAQRAIHSPLPG